MSFNPDRINIHELAIEEPESQSELPFDPERDITEEDWKSIIENFERIKKLENNWGNISYYGAEIKILDPNANLGLDETIWIGMKSRLESHRAEGFWFSFCQQAMAMKIIDPCLDLDLDADALQYMKNWAREGGKNHDWGNFTSQEMAMKIINPEMDLDLDEIVRQGMKDRLEKCRRSGWFDVFAIQAREMRIIDPEVDLNLNQDTWQGMRDNLEHQRRNNQFWQNFAHHAASMKILAAEKVEVTDKGLEITMPERKESLKSAIPPLPETKQF